ncbi:MAG: NADH-quinone oxidoreductase subunit NuoG [Actinomycetota bacterium]
MPDSDNSKQLNLTINGIEVTSAPGRMLIDVAEEAGVFVPRFCYHPGLESVAACRMCLVSIEGSKRPLEPACATPVMDAMVVHTDSEAAVEAQEAVLELLLINHPLDCPICDRGGECPLQDQTLKFGPGKSRYFEGKRHFRKALPISDLVTLDRERCVLCWRCVRFCNEVSGDKFIDLMDRGSHSQINTADDEPFDSYFSGNTIQICPVGALTSTSYRFLSRPWDLVSASSTCSYCAVGCPISLEHRDGEVLRAQALPNEQVNDFWNCDKGRFGHRYVSNPDRLKSPLVRDGSQLKRVGWSEALDLVTEALKKTLSDAGPSSVAMIGGSHATNEDLYSAQHLFRRVVGTDSLDFRTFDAAFPYETLATKVMGSTATLDDLDGAGCLLWLGPDPKEELPVLYLRIRRAVAKGMKLVVVHPRKISLCEIGLHVASIPGREAEVVAALAGGGSSGLPASGPLREAAEALASKSIIVAVGQRFVGTWMHDEVKAAADLIHEHEDARLLMLVPNANSQGAIDMGITPQRGPGHVQQGTGMDTRNILMGAVEGKIKFLWLMGADIVSDFPDQKLARDALASGAFVVVSELFPTDTALSASVVLPARSFAEKEGTFTNLERRLQKVDPAVAAPGVALADWLIFEHVAQRLGSPAGWTSAGDVMNAITNEVPTHAGLTWDRLGDEIQIGVGAGPSEGPAGADEQAAWPLSWELRAVDTRSRTGAIWDAAGAPEQTAGLTAHPRPTSVEAAKPGLLRLLASRSLYDNGAMVSRSPELKNLIAAPTVEIHPDDAAQLSLNDGDGVSVTSERGAISAKVRVSTNTPRHAAHMFFDQPGARVNVLMDSASPTTYVGLTRIR